MLGKVDLNKIDRDQQWEEVKRNEVERGKKKAAQPWGYVHIFHACTRLWIR
jgi:hypothetical protein